MKNLNKKITIGKLASPHGLCGWLNCYSFADPQKRLFNYSPLFLFKSKKEWLPITIEEFKAHGDHWVVKLENCDDRYKAQTYTNTLLGVERSQLPKLEKDEYYWVDLEGLKVFDSEGKCLGRIDYLFETGSNDVIVVKGEKEYLIPYRKDIIISIDLEKEKMIVDWGLE